MTQPPPPAADRPHKPVGDAEEVYLAGSPLLCGELFKGFFWLLAGIAFIAIPSQSYTPTASVWRCPSILQMIVIGLVLLTIPWLATKRVGTG